MDLLQVAILGIGAGSAYVLIAHGIVLVYRGSGTLNFAQGAIAMMTAQIFYSVRDDRGWSTPASMVLALAFAATVGLVMQNVVLGPLRKSAALVRLVTTLGLLTLLLGLANLWWDTFRIVTGVLPRGAKHVGDDLTIPVDRLWVLGICVVLTLVLHQVYQRTRFGLATAGAAENERAAISLGWSPGLLATVNWMVGCALAGLAGILLSSIVGLSTTSLTLTVVPGMAAALVGRFASFWLTLAGGLGIGMAQSLVVRYVSEPGWSDAIPFLLITALIVVRGQALPLRGEVLERPVRVGTGRVSPFVLVPLIAVGFVAIGTLSSDWVLALTTSLGLAIVSLSFIVLTGYAGQISLAQLTLAGVGAWIAGVASYYWELSMPAAILVAVAVTVAVGVLTGLPALRCRGMNLAVVTLGMSVVIEGVILANHRWQGGLNGLKVQRPVFFGIDLRYVAHPERYAAFLLIAFILAATMVANIRRSQSGRKLLALRSNERAAASLGISVVGGKLFAFSLAAGFAGLGGAIMAFQFTQANLANYTTLGSITLLLNTVVGGMGFVFGSVQGGLAGHQGIVAYLLSKIGGDSSQYLTVIGGGLVLVMMLVHPDGIASRMSDVFAHLQRRRAERRVAEIPALDVQSAHEHDRHGLTLDVSGVSVRFGSVDAVSDVSFSVAPGEVVGIIGPNGAGKTTLIDALCGFVKSSGRVRLGEHDLDRRSASSRARSGLSRTFQGVELFDDMSVFENIQVAAACNDRVRFGLSYVRDMIWPRRRPLPSVAVAAIHDLQMVDDLPLLPSEVPAGRQRLVGIARALSSNPKVICLDEPAAGLGDVEVAELLRLVRHVAEEWNLGVIVIEHNVEFVRKVSDRVIALDLGRVIAEGAPADVLASPRVVAAYIGESDPPAGSDDAPYSAVAVEA